MLTTRDNPFNPYTQWDSWLQWDRDHGYYTNELLARVANASLDMDEDQRDELIEMAQLYILENDITQMYILVNKDSETE